MRSRKGMVLLLVVGLVVLAIAPSASAAKPVTFSYEIVDIGFPVGECDDGSWILEDSTIQITERLYFDNDGNLTRVKVHGDIVDGRVYKDSSPFNWLPEVAHFNFTVYPEEGILVQRGLTARVNVPGSGHVLLDAGRFVMDLFTGDVLWQAGPHQHVNGEVDELCEALS